MNPNSGRFISQKWVFIAFAIMAIILASFVPSVLATPPLVKQMYKGGWPGADELKSVHEQFLLQRAVQSYMMTLPTLNVIGLRDGSHPRSLMASTRRTGSSRFPDARR
jgi:hypothetical protein